ncbi:TlrC/CarA/OleB/SrmB family ABC-F type ribosomal protection protein [Nocardia donostiensis]|uniref:Tylosin resistance protein TlrC n=1 Tax=Nocardia donostiensis TaxID=1538463 RepID=A0A1V2TKP7_9NOCA|nr:TlrC/CarA/OleB/SrmB family ABC-F type ribosomal protection protein [Nocardia donostiensis]ONM50107.1 tylosin resistance protein TlrC [Nocardia donostiensis]OQS15769.1 tylosin resistance protein TlrC [Nocardia donostiensis]OQS23574.1 tylosin resistance protein TlrC [Nocardia donostiensis]
MPTAAQLTLTDITKRYADRVVFDRVTLSIRPGETVGIVGDNGSGKSTLLKLLAGVQQPDNGEVIVIAPGGVGYLAQTLDLPGTSTVADAIDLALADIRDLEKHLRAAEADLGTGASIQAKLDTYAELMARYEARGGYQADHRVDAALAGLGLPGLDRARRLATLSGGERSRLALAATLASAPEVLLLDEPSNDLDDAAVAWLEQHLRNHRGTVVAVTHDRVFLERITSTVVEVAGGKVARFGDGYQGYLAAKAAQRRRWAEDYERWRTELARSRKLAESNVVRLEAIPRKLPLAVFAAGPFRARGRDHGARSRIRNAKERVARLTDNPVAPPPDPLSFTPGLPRGDTTELDGPVAELSDITVAGRLRLAGLRLGDTERLLVTGPNGAGKTTLLRLLAGTLIPDSGSVRVRGRVGLLRQEEVAWPAATTVLQAFAAGRPWHSEEYTEELLGLGLFRREDLRLRVGDLSYGQRRRIELARLVSDPVDLLLLDEPTNHLAPALVEELEDALTDYRGAVVLVTHDRLLRARFAGTRLELASGRVASTAA